MSAIVTGESGATDAILRFDVIDARRKELKISKGHLAKLAGVDQSTIWRYRRGMKPSLDVAERLADGLQLSVDEIKVRRDAQPACAPKPRAGGR